MSDMNGKKLVYEMFPAQIMDLYREIQHHPNLLKLLHDQDNKDVYIQLMEIAAYCEIVVIGDFTRQDILELCTAMTKKLYSRRSSIILPM